MEIFFVHDQPRVLAGAKRFIAFRKNIEEYKINGGTFYTGDAISYVEAMESVKSRSQLLRDKSNQMNAQDKAIVDATYEYFLQIVDGERGDAFTLMMTPFEDWCDILQEDKYTIPDIYLKK